MPYDLLAAITAALDGTGPAVTNAPTTTAVADRAGSGTAAILTTSGSTSGVGRPVALGAAALRASAAATEARLSGPGQWLLALPTDHVAGLQVLIRSVLAGTVPVVVRPGRFTPAALAAGLRAMRTDVPRYLSLVPTQLVRVLTDGGSAVDLLRTCAAVLVGGAATAGGVLAAARETGIPVVTTYGMTETCGGCVYDGVPLDGVDVRLAADGRIHLAGAVLADGYLDDGPDPFVQFAGRRWLRTGDAGTLEGDTLAVLGRVDDVLVTGGLNVHPAAVERAITALDSVAEVAVVGVPDAEWGESVTAVVVPRPGVAPPDLATVRAAAGGGPAAPRALLVRAGLPLRGPGKVDRRAVAASAAADLAAGLGEQHG
ncbi:AMP-dependent synthetase [Occultella glacieicola]|uniref:AMP-dependent synthetase n=1 Tax=Occultella glacieicola TaxID=2518684 RepID=A0ABY2E1D3_9MICO|nr:AMP-dependent synthetase [Occultella glacieicola]